MPVVYRLKMDRGLTMDVVFYIYTIIILLVCVLAGTASFSAYLVSHRRVFLFVLITFMFYFLDLALIFQDEFLVQNLSFQETNFYLVEHSFLRTLLGGGFLAGIWFVVLDYLGQKLKSPLGIIPIVVYFLGCWLISTFMPAGQVEQYCFYTMRQVFLFWTLGYILFHYHRIKGDEMGRLRMRRHLMVYCIFFGLTCCILLEDTVNILLVDPSFYSDALWLYVSERNISENVLIICCAVWAIRAASKTLSMRFEKPPANEEQSMASYIDGSLGYYCKRNGLTDRESEVLRLVLLGKDNQNIASEMNLALGTVKTHVHNILKKTGQATRVELIRDFWQE